MSRPQITGEASPAYLYSLAAAKFFASDQELEAERLRVHNVDGRADLLSYFLSHRDENGEPYSDDYMIDIVLNFIIAGR